MLRKKVLIGLLALAFGLAVLGCDDGGGGPKGGGNSTPTADDFTISGAEIFIYDGSAKTVTVTAKPGKTTGAVSVKYDGDAAAPSAEGKYAVTFDVTASTGWNEVSGLQAGTLVIHTEADAFVGGGDGTADDNGEIAKGTTGETKTVYLTGYYGGTSPQTAWYSIDGVKKDLSTDPSHGYAMTVVGSDVYIAGDDNGPSGTTACYWKNGTKTSFNFPGSSGAIAVVGTDVYVAGHRNSDPWNPYYWKNGTITNMDNTGGSRANGIVVVDSDVYVAGNCTYNSITVACYWKNGTKTNLSTVTSQTTAIAVAGSDIYVTGTYNNGSSNIACYWKNGTKTDLLDVGSTAKAIAVVGQDVYIAGDYYNGSNRIACYWKNGVKTDVPTLNSYAVGIAVEGSDVYIGGHYNNDSDRIVCYWKNGVKTDVLTGLYEQTMALGSASTTAPGAPTGLTASAASATSINLNWSSTAGASGYRVYQSTSADGTYYSLGTATYNSCTVSGLSPNTTYYYKVSAYNGNGEGSPSSSVSASTSSGSAVSSTVYFTIRNQTGYKMTYYNLYYAGTYNDVIDYGPILLGDLPSGSSARCYIGGSKVAANNRYDIEARIVTSSGLLYKRLTNQTITAGTSITFK